MAQIHVIGFSDNNYSTIAVNRSDVNFTDDAPFSLPAAVYYVIVALGIPGNILSAIVWLRHHVASNSSAFYLAALAINDLAFLLVYLILNIFQCHRTRFCQSVSCIRWSAAILEPLLVLGLSVCRTSDCHSSPVTGMLL